MKVILLEDVKAKGKKDDIIDVTPGYAQNYLIKNKLAVPYTENSKKILNEQIKERQKLEEELISDLNLIKDKLNNKEIKFIVKTGKDDKVFGSISSKQIADEIYSKYNIKIDKKNINIKNTIDTLGIHDIEIKLHKKIKFSIKVNLIK